MTSAVRRIAVVGPGLMGLVRELEMRGLDRRGSRRHQGESA